MMDTRLIYCCGCGHQVNARLTSGSEIYPHRPDLADIPMWRCDDCGNYVGCHHKTENPTLPLGHIPTTELRKARNHIHRLIDPVWKSGKAKRGELYRRIGEHLGRQFHTAEICSIEEARDVYRAAQQIIRGIK